MSDVIDTPGPVEALKRAVQIVGTQAALGERIGALAGERPVFQATVSKWLRERGGAPAEWAVFIAEATAWQVTPVELCPEAFPLHLVRLHRVQADEALAPAS